MKKTMQDWGKEAKAAELHLPPPHQDSTEYRLDALLYAAVLLILLALCGLYQVAMLREDLKASASPTTSHECNVNYRVSPVETHQWKGYTK
jgi:hypothetical protein